MLVARSTLSNAPEPLYTSTRVVAAADIAIAEICLPEKKAWQIPELRNSAAPHLFLPTNTNANATDVMDLMVGRIWNGIWNV